MIVVDNKIYDRSRAALEIAKRMDCLWPAMYAFMIVPSFIRNFIYDWISKNRYKWFGVRSECMIPTREMKGRFL